MTPVRAKGRNSSKLDQQFSAKISSREITPGSSPGHSQSFIGKAHRLPVMEEVFNQRQVPQQFMNEGGTQSSAQYFLSNTPAQPWRKNLRRFEMPLPNGEFRNVGAVTPSHHTSIKLKLAPLNSSPDHPSANTILNRPVNPIGGELRGSDVTSGRHGSEIS